MMMGGVQCAVLTDYVSRKKIFANNSYKRNENSVVITIIIRLEYYKIDKLISNH